MDISVLSIFVIFITFLNTLRFSNGIHDGPLTLLVSFDGFRWDYLQKTDTPNFDQLIAEGSFVPDGILNSFVTKTFPNHFTIATGMWEESHGMVGNNFYDPKLKEHFSIGQNDSTDPKWWDNGAEPIWVTNQLHGGRSGVYYWPGSETKIKGVLPYHYKQYNNTTPFKTRVDGIIDWFTAEEDPINLGLLYFNEPDHTGHMKGPESEEIKSVIQMCDNITGYLMQRLKEADLYDKINIIITSDHGMTELDASRVVKLDDYVNRDLYDYVDQTPIAAINPYDPKNIVTLYNALRLAPHLTVYMKGSTASGIPARFHYSNNPRIMPIIAMADEGWSIVRNMSDYEKLFAGEKKGGHGYDNSLKSMHPFFIARGPAIRKNFTSEQIKNVDIYPMICEIMNLKPSPNNGSLQVVNQMLNISGHSGHGNDGYGHFHISERLIIAMIVAGTISLIAAILLTGMCWRQRKYRLTDYIPEPPVIDAESKQALLSAEEEA